jgi:hypothetical protein
MKKHILILVGFMMLAFVATGQSYLITPAGYKAADIFPDYKDFQAFDIYDSLLYATDGDTIHCLDLESGEVVRKYGKQAG